MHVKFIKNDYQKEICEKAIQIITREKKVGLDIFTSGGKSIIASEIIEYLRDKKGIKNVLVVAKEGTWCALTSRMKQIGFDTTNVYHVTNSKLSRGFSLKDCITEQGVSSDDIDLILFDECHQLFGTNIRQELDANAGYTYSKYVIAMTATTYTGIKMINSLKEIVGEENTVKFDLNDAVARDIIDPMNIVEVKLNCKPEYHKQINDLLNCSGVSITNKKILKFAESTKRKIDAANIDTLSGVIYQSIVLNARKYKVKLDATNGARVLVFFNRIEDIHRYKDYIVTAIGKAYPRAKVNYIEYTSRSSEDENKEAIKLLTATKADSNTVDIITTCDVGAESFHPVNIQLGLIFGGTQSIRKAIQRIGRFIVLKQYKTSDYIIIDFSESNKIGTTTITTGKTDLSHRARDISIYNRYFTDSAAVIEDVLDEYSNSINIEVSSLDVNILDMFDRLNVLVNVTVGNDDLINFIDSHLDTINKKYFGNIAKFLKDNENKYSEIKANNYRQRFNAIRKYMVYPGLKQSDLDILSESFGKYGAGLYMGENTSVNMTSDINILYRRINSGSYNIDDNYRQFVKKTYSSDCIAMIRSNKDMLNNMYNRVVRSVPDCYSVSRESVLYNKFILINKLCAKHMSDGKLDKMGNELACMLAIYLDTYYAMSQDKELKNVISTYLTMMNDIGLKINNISNENKKQIKQVFELDIVRHIASSTNADVKIKNRRMENAILRLCCEKLSKIQKQAIVLCISDRVNTSMDDFIEDGLKLTNTYKLLNQTYEDISYKNLKELQTFIDNGGYIPKKLMKQFNVEGLGKKYVIMLQVKKNGVRAKTGNLTSSEYLSIFIKDTEVLKDMKSLSLFKSGKLSDTHGNYDKILTRVKFKLSYSDIDSLYKVRKAKILTAEHYNDVIEDLYE